MRRGATTPAGTRSSSTSRPGKPTGDAFIEAFNSQLPPECLSALWFLSMILSGVTGKLLSLNGGSFK
jgi:transposase InsO family protein